MFAFGNMMKWLAMSLIGANKVSLDMAKENFKSFGAVEERYLSMCFEIFPTTQKTKL